LYHGLNDDLLPIKNVHLTYQYLKDNFAANLTFDTERGLAHSVSPKELRQLKAWVNEHMKENKEEL